MSHAVTSTNDGKRYGYDCNGSMVFEGNPTMTWEANNYPGVIQNGMVVATFAYSRFARERALGTLGEDNLTWQ